MKLFDTKLNAILLNENVGNDRHLFLEFLAALSSSHNRSKIPEAIKELKRLDASQISTILSQFKGSGDIDSIPLAIPTSDVNYLMVKMGFSESDIFMTMHRLGTKQHENLHYMKRGYYRDMKIDDHI